LDEDLAAGNISADDYRVRRDQVLSSAVSSEPQGGTPTPGDDSQTSNSTQVINPVSPQNHGQQPAADSTQAVPPPGTSRPQGTPNWQQAPANWQQSPQPPQAAAPADHGWQPQGQSPQQQPWNAPQQDARPPWGGDELPPITERNAPWSGHGQDSFEAKESTNKPRKALLSTLAVVVVAGLGVAVWALFIRPSDDPGSTAAAAGSSSQSSPTSATTTTTSQTPLEEPPPTEEKPEGVKDALVKPKGDTRDGGGKFDLDKLKDRELLPKPMIKTLDDGDMSKGLLRTTKVGDAVVGMYSLKVEDEDAARAAAKKYATAQRKGNLPRVRDYSLKGVPVLGTDQGENPVYRAVYVLYDHVVIVEVYGSDAAKVTKLFTNLLDKQIAHAPPTVREPF